VRITPEGRVIISSGQSKQSARHRQGFSRAVGAAERGAGRSSQAAPAAASNGTGGLLAALDWLDSLSANGLDGQSLNEIGLRSGVLTVEDQRNGSVLAFKNISLSLRRPSGGGAALSVGEEGRNGWELKVVVGAPAHGVRSVDISADKVPLNNLLLAARLRDFT